MATVVIARVPCDSCLVLVGLAELDVRHVHRHAHHCMQQHMCPTVRVGLPENDMLLDGSNGVLHSLSVIIYLAVVCKQSHKLGPSHDWFLRPLDWHPTTINQRRKSLRI